MKSLILLCVFTMASLAMADSETYPRGCIYINGECDSECEEGTHAYTTSCGLLTPEATCEEPEPVEGHSFICDYSECYCDPPTVRDPVTKKCVKLEDCSKSDGNERDEILD